MRRVVLIIIAVAIAFSVKAENDHLNIVYTQGRVRNALSLKRSDITYINLPLDLGDKSSYMTVCDKNGNLVHIAFENVVRARFESVIPSMSIDIEDGKEVVMKETYLNATIVVDGNEMYPDFASMPVTIKGRGNLSWGFPKKPYRLKFAKKQSLCGLKAAKSYVLLANYVDPTLMRNAAAFKIAELLGMPYTNHAVPVNLTVNGTYRGSYMLTEKVGINGASVNIDETQGILFEISAEYDEPFKFRSANFNLPVMIKDPDLSELYADEPDPDAAATQALAEWQVDFQRFEDAVAGIGDHHYSEYVDMQSVVDYMIVYNLVGNRELRWPKSFYVHKPTRDSKYRFGPVWDFDWAFTFDYCENCAVVDAPLIDPEFDMPGARFIRVLCADAEFQKLYAERWNYFKAELYPQLLDYIRDYAQLVEVSAYQNGKIHPSTEENLLVWSSGHFADCYPKLLQWLSDRIAYIDSAPNFGLY